MNLAARNLLQDKTRLALSVTGVALAVMLILDPETFVTPAEPALEVHRP